MVNLIYIRAAIQQATGKVLPLEDIVDLLVDEGLITQDQADDENLIFRGYAEFFETEEAATKVERADHYIDREEDYGEDE
jgi:hypothetical protein